nr:phenylalanyl-tRNA synthetase subunit beta [uncultured bacterium]
MKISFNWLKEYINIDLDAKTVSEILTDIGLEVEKVETIESIPGGLKGLKIGHILTKEKHPDADRLNITTVDAGNESPQQIVCGAPNVAVGQKVVVALPGTTIHPLEGEAFKIKKAKIRGVESFGMICAEDEIGLGASHDGIMVLKEDAPVGLDASKFFKVENETIIEIGLTPNRADAMGHIGVARDLLAALKYKGLIAENETLKTPDTGSFSVKSNDANINISVEEPAACPRYAGVVINDVKVEESPEWLQNKLRSIGLSPINNIVDITNFVLHEYGQPLHAFDANFVGSNVIVKKLSKGTKFTTLDDVERELSENDLMICNEKGGMCLAGVFGGIDSGVKLETTTVFLESAYFNPVSVRKTAKRHGFNTDASFRFERGIDINTAIPALKRAALLIEEIAGGKVASEIIDIYPTAIEDFVFEVDCNRISKLCGVGFAQADIERIVTLLDITILNKEGSKLKIQVPSYRVDVLREADIAEEVLRIYGFNNVPIPEKLNSSITYRPKVDKENLQNMVSDMLVSFGLNEAMSNSLTKDSYVDLANTPSIKSEFNVAMLNPLSIDLNVMRQSLLFNGLEAVRLNQNHGSDSVKLFEFGKIYQKFESGFSESSQLAVFLSGRNTEELWNGSKSDVSFFTLKGVVESLLHKIGGGRHKASATKNDLLEDGLSYKVGKKKVVDFGWIRADLKKEFGLNNDVFYAEFNWDALLDITANSSVKFKELEKFPGVKRDLSLLLNEKIKFSEIVSIAKSCNSELLKEVSLFDVYKGKNMEKGKKSYAVRFALQDKNKTLKEKEIDGVMSKIQLSLTEKLEAELR